MDRVADELWLGADEIDSGPVESPCHAEGGTRTITEGDGRSNESDALPGESGRSAVRVRASTEGSDDSSRRSDALSRGTVTVQGESDPISRDSEHWPDDARRPSADSGRSPRGNTGLPGKETRSVGPVVAGNA